ncbi:MAG: Carbonic anhydrase, gamma class, partial [uncultured Nocardioidaceae bacterium]
DRQQQLRRGAALRRTEDRRGGLRRSHRGGRRRRHPGLPVEHLVRRRRPRGRGADRHRAGLQRAGRVHPALRSGLPPDGRPGGHRRAPRRPPRGAGRRRRARGHGQRRDERRAHRRRVDRRRRGGRHAEHRGAAGVRGRRHPGEGGPPEHRRGPRPHPEERRELHRTAARRAQGPAGRPATAAPGRRVLRRRHAL